MTASSPEFRRGIVGVPDYRVDTIGPKQARAALVIPVLNENGRLTGQLAQLQSVQPPVDVVIADGGSTDGSTGLEGLRDLGVTALLTKLGDGKLSAQLRMAFRYCLDEGYESVITMDGNGKDGADGVFGILSALEDGFDFVQGSRFVKGGTAVNTPASRYLAIRLVHAPLTSVGARAWYTDTTNGFRGHSRRLLEDPRVDPFRAEFDTYELLAYLPIQASRLGYEVGETPVSRSYPKGATPTKIHGFGAQLALLKILGNAVRGRYAPTASRNGG